MKPLTRIPLRKSSKTPLDTMLGMLDLLLTTTMSIKQREYIEVACSSGWTLMSLVDSMLTFSEIKSGQIKFAKQKCHLTEILDEVIQQLAEKALKKSLNLGYVIETNPEDEAIVKSIVNLARELNIKTVAEGVETMGQKAILAKLNCHSFQGFLISKPLSPDSFYQQFLKS